MGGTVFIWQYSLLVLLRILRGVPFLCPHKKGTKESGWGEALTAKPFVTAYLV